jgi:shikimate kinase
MMEQPEYSSARIYLVGMMGVGKSTLGKQLARQLHYSFLDLDKAIEAVAGSTITTIFEESGEAGFREAERKVLYNTASRDHIVIATGGGTPCFFDNMEWMNKHGLTIYLRANTAFVLSRIGPVQDKRPLLKGKSPDEMEKFVQHLIETRTPYYNAAAKQVDLPVKSLKDIVKSML